MATSITRSSLTRLFTGVLVFLTTVQGAIPGMPIENPTTKAIIGAILMFLVVGLTAWKQYLSIEIQNNALWPTLIVAIIATLGGLNDLINAIPLSATGSQWVHIAITVISMMLALLSKQLFPTEEAKIIEQTKSALVETPPVKPILPPNTH